MNKQKNMFFPLISRLDRMIKDSPVILCIEGGSASGKTTLAGILNSFYDCTVLHMDDFFLRPEQRTPSRLAEAGGNVDRERFSEEVITPLLNGNSISYRKFNCTSSQILPSEVIFPKRLCVIEGAYSMHPYFGKYYNLSVFLDISPDYQRERISKRNTPDMAKKFTSTWIPLENVYFDTYRIKEKCDLHFFVDEFKSL